MEVKIPKSNYYAILKKEGEYYIIPSTENPHKHDWVIAKIEAEKQGISLTEDYKINFNVSFNEPILSEMEQNVADYVAKKDWKDEYIENQIEKDGNLNRLLKFRDECLNSQDPIVESVRQILLDRSNVGIKKYNTTLQENNKDNYLQHSFEEQCDNLLYTYKLIQQKEDITQIVKNEPNDGALGKLIREIYGK